MTFYLGFLAVKENNVAKTLDIKDIASSLIVLSEHQTGNIQKDNWMPVEMEVAPATVQKTPIEIYDEMTIAQREEALYAGTLHLEYSGLYTYSSERLSVSRGALYFNGHKETYYSEKVLPGNGLNIPGRHVADDGTIRDYEGFISVASDYSFMSKGTIVKGSL